MATTTSAAVTPCDEQESARKTTEPRVASARGRGLAIGGRCIGRRAAAAEAGVVRGDAAAGLMHELSREAPPKAPPT